MTRPGKAAFFGAGTPPRSPKNVRIANTWTGAGERRGDRLRQSADANPRRARYKIERAYWTLDGKPVDLAAIKQNDSFVVLDGYRI